MLKQYTPSRMVTEITYEIAFDDGACNGYGFPCDANGRILDNMPDAAKANYKWCLEHPEKFERYNTVVRNTRRYREPATGICICGETVELWDQYYGSCQCERCGRWYNLFGQELVPPEQWEEDPSADDIYDNNGWE